MLYRIYSTGKKNLKKDKTSTLILNYNRNPRPMQTILESNIKYLQTAYRARLDTLAEEDEALESSLVNNGSVWKGRIREAGISNY